MSLKNLLFRACVLLLSLSSLSAQSKGAFENEEDEIGVFRENSLQKKKRRANISAIYIYTYLCSLARFVF